MKRTVALVLVLAFTAGSGVVAAQQGIEMVLKYKQFAVAHYPLPQKSNAKTLPFIEGQMTGGAKEKFGVAFGAAAKGAAFVEFVGPDGKVIKSVTVTDVLGQLAAQADRAQADAKLSGYRRTEQRILVALPAGSATLILRALLTGEPESEGATKNLVLTIALESAQAMQAGLRLTLPVVGSVEAQGNGIVIAPKSGGAALAVAFSPAARTVAMQKGAVVVSSPVMQIGAQREQAVLWMVVQGFGAATPAAAKAEAIRMLKSQGPADTEPQVIVVSTADRRKSQPGDTVQYTLVCVNIGAADAPDVVLRNPVAGGARYIEGSATDGGAALRVIRSDALVPGSSVAELQWAFPTPLRPGEERKVGFQVVIR